MSESHLFGWFWQKKTAWIRAEKKPFCGGTGTGGDDFSVTGSSEGFLWKNGGCKKFNIHWIDASDELNWLRFCVVRMIYDWFWNWLWGIYGKSPLETVISFEAFRNPWEPVLKVHVVIFGYRYCFGKPPRSRSYLYHPIFSLMFFFGGSEFDDVLWSFNGGWGSFQDLRHGFLVPRKWFGFAQHSWLSVGHATPLIFQRTDP